LRDRHQCQRHDQADRDHAVQRVLWLRGARSIVARTVRRQERRLDLAAQCRHQEHQWRDLVLQARHRRRETRPRQPEGSMMRRARPLLGTYVEIDADGIAEGALDRAVSAAFAAVALVHRLMSFHEPDSDVSRLNRSAASGPVAVHPWTASVLRRARVLFDATDGLFDCAIGHDLVRLGLLPAHDLGPAEAGDFSAVEFLPGNRLAFAARIVLDLGGIAKGFAVDRAIAVLRAHGVRDALVNAGGDMRVMGKTAQPIYIRHPTEPAQLVFAGTLQNGAIATSSPTATLTMVEG